MGHAAITSYVDVAQLVLYAFWIFFFGLVYYLLRENHREGYPLDSGGRGVIEGWPKAPKPKVFLLPNGHEALSPDPNEPPQQFNGEPVHRFAGAPIEPVGDPFTARVGPGAWAEREDEPEVDYLGNVRIRPLRVMPAYGVSAKDVDPRGLDVMAGDGEIAGTVTDLWVDSSDMLFRYLQVRLVDGSREVLVPFNFARVRKSGPVEVWALHAKHFAGVPATKSDDSVTMQEEERLVAYFGAGLLYADEQRAEPLI